MPSILPFVPNIPNYRVGTTLNDRQYLFDVHWNARESAWYFDVLDDEETTIRAGIKIVLGVALGVRSQDPNFPPGIFIAADLAGQSKEAGFDDLGVRIVVYYFEPGE